MMNSPHHQYYRANDGRWRGRIRFEITDPQRLRESALTSADQWTVRSLAAASRLSILIMSTTVDYYSRGHQNEVFHTTGVSILGITLFHSRESILLHDDGQLFQLNGTQKFFPRLWKVTPWFASGSVAADHHGAFYRIPFFGENLEQQTRLSDQGIDVIQTTPFSLARILLRRRGVSS